MNIKERQINSSPGFRKKSNKLVDSILKRIVISLIIILILFLSISLASAHQPRIVSKELTQIENPEVSQAFYGELKGAPDYYQISADTSFKLYVGILVPDIKGIDKDVSAEISIHSKYKNNEDEEEYANNEEEKLFLLDGLDFNWQHYYEEFAGDYYYYGPELKANEDRQDFIPEGVKVDKGVYTIKVFSPDNKGKYVLVVGEKEQFPLQEIINTIITLPVLKSDFFEKPIYTAYFNLTGLFMLIFLFLVILLFFLFFWLVKRYRKKIRNI